MVRLALDRGGAEVEALDVGRTREAVKRRGDDGDRADSFEADALAPRIDVEDLAVHADADRRGDHRIMEEAAIDNDVLGKGLGHLLDLRPAHADDVVLLL